MEHIEHDGVQQHHCRIEDVEEDFMCVHITSITLEHLDDTVNMPDTDHDTAHIEQKDDGS